MKAIVQDQYGSPDDVLQLREVEMPGVGDDEVLVRVRAASVHPDVWHVVTGRPYILRLLGAGLRKPKCVIPGTDVAGHVEKVGANVTAFKPGDAVFGESFPNFQWRNGGTFAEYVAVPQNILALKPGNVTFEQAASVPTAGIIALHNLRAGLPLQGDQRLPPAFHVLINGAAGGVGAVALQLAKAYGARVTGVDSTDKLEMVRSLGADHAIDYARENFTRSGQRYDLIFDVASNLSFPDCKRALTPTGKYVLIGHDHFGAATGPVLGSLPRMMKLLALASFERHLPKPNVAVPNKKEIMAVLKDFLAAGQLTPIVDRTFPLSEVPQAMRYLQTGQARGRIVITP